jgi:GNAT superfamily N-acetyltransferase
MASTVARPLSAENLSGLLVREITGTEFVPQTFTLRYEIWKDEATLKPEIHARGSITDEHDAHARHWAVLQAGRIVAAARMCIHDLQEDTPDSPAFSHIRLRSPVATLNRLVVHRSARRHGLAALLDVCRIEAARRMGAECVVGTAIRARIPPLERLGFRRLLGSKWVISYAESLEFHAMVLNFE